MNTAIADTTKTTPTKSTTQHDYILLDGSGSMTDKWWETLTAVQTYVNTLKNQNVNSQILLHVFDSTDRDYIARNVNINDWKSLTNDPVGAYWGGTPLYDAISLMGRRLRDLDPPRCSIVIVTDGQENESKFCDLTQAKAILDWCRAKGWQITFIGAEFNNRMQAAGLGANENEMIGVHTKMLESAVEALAKKRAKYGLYGTPMHYTDDELQQFGGFLENKTNGNG